MKYERQCHSVESKNPLSWLKHSGQDGRKRAEKSTTNRSHKQHD